MNDNHIAGERKKVDEAPTDLVEAVWNLLLSADAYVEEYETPLVPFNTKSRLFVELRSAFESVRANGSPADSVKCFRCGHAAHSGSCVNVAPLDPDAYFGKKLSYYSAAIAPRASYGSGMIDAIEDFAPVPRADADTADHAAKEKK